jgi:hypothetical protein
MRELWNLFGKAVEACQSLVLLFEMTAIQYAFHRGRLWHELRWNRGVVTVQPGDRRIIDQEAALSLLACTGGFASAIAGALCAEVLFGAVPCGGMPCAKAAAE